MGRASTFAAPASARGWDRSDLLRVTVRQGLALAALVLVGLLAPRSVDPASGDPPARRLATLLTASFSGGDGTVAASRRFWDRSAAADADWFAESGSLLRRNGLGWVHDDVFRVWSRRTDLAFATVQMAVRFNRWERGARDWHGVNLWLNRRLRTPADGSRISDGPRQEGYTVDLINRDGRIYLQKKVGERYLILARRRWSPAPGRWYRWGGRVIDNGDGTNTVQVLVDGRVIQQARDDGSVGGPRLTGGRIGLRGDHANFNVDELRVTRPARTRSARRGR